MGAEALGAPDAPAAAQSGGRIAAVSLGAPSTLPARVSAMLAHKRLVVVDLSTGAAGAAQLLDLSRRREAGSCWSRSSAAMTPSPGLAGGGGGSTAATIDAWVESACKTVPTTDYEAAATAGAEGQSLYACSTAALPASITRSLSAGLTTMLPNECVFLLSGSAHPQPGLDGIRCRLAFRCLRNMVSALNQQARAADMPSACSRASPRPVSPPASWKRSPICLLISIAVRKSSAAGRVVARRQMRPAAAVQRFRREVSLGELVGKDKRLQGARPCPYLPRRKSAC